MTNNLTKKVTVLITIVITAVLMFGAGVMASSYLTFTGEETLNESDNKVGQIVDMLERVADGKADAEGSLADAIERIKELENIGESNKALRDEIKRLEKDVSNLEKEIEKANKQVGKHGDNIDKHYDKALKIGGGE